MRNLFRPALPPGVVALMSARMRLVLARLPEFVSLLCNIACWSMDGPLRGEWAMPPNDAAGVARRWGEVMFSLACPAHCWERPRRHVALRPRCGSHLCMRIEQFLWIRFAISVCGERRHGRI